MKIHHSPHHWVAVALVLAALLLTLSEAHGQSSGAAAAFEGRPAMAGAQAGQGAQAGPPQGGIGVQGASSNLATREGAPPAQDDSILKPARDNGISKPARDNSITKPARDNSIAKEERSTVKKTKRAAKRVIKRSRTGVGEIDS